MGHALLTHDHSLLGVQVAPRPGDPEQWELELWGSSKLGAQLGEGAVVLVTERGHGEPLRWRGHMSPKNSVTW